MKKRLIAVYLAAVFCLLCGCHPVTRQDIASRIVTQITVTCETCSDFTRRFYNTNEKMQLILLYIRCLKPRFAPQTDPEPLAGRTICITVTCADNTTRIYRQKDNLYFQEGTGPWQQVRPDQGSDLWRIVLFTPSDPEAHPRLSPDLPRLRGWFNAAALLPARRYGCPTWMPWKTG